MSDSTGSVLSLAAQIVAAHVANNRVDPVDLPKLINDVHIALANAEQATTAPPRGEPAVDIKRSVRSDHLVCIGWREIGPIVSSQLPNAAARKGRLSSIL